LTSVVVVVVVYLGASVCGLDTLGHLLCAITILLYYNSSQVPAPHHGHNSNRTEEMT
jgi:hypothetical protein